MPKPLIGIYSYYHIEENEFITEHTEIWGGYVRWLEQAGAEVIALHYWYTNEELDNIIRRINGILLTGVFRTVNLSDIFEQKALYMIDKAIELNNQGDFFPIWATCFSSELLLCKAINSAKLITTVESFRVYEQSFLYPKAYNARMFSHFSYKDFELITKHNSTFQLHTKGITEKDYMQHPILSDFYDLTGYGINKIGLKYINSFEAKQYPIYGILYHAEVIPYARSNAMQYNHTNESIKLSQLHALFFINEARKSSHIFPQCLKEKYSFLSSYKESSQYIFKNNYYNFYLNNNAI